MFSNNSFENVADLAVSENNAVVFVSVSAGKTVFGIASSVFELNEQSTNHITISGQQGGALDFYPFNTCLPSVKLVLSETFTYTLFNAGTRIVSGLNNFCSHCSLVSGSAFDSQAYCDTLGSSAVNCTSLEIINSDELELVTCPTTGCTAPNVFDVLLCVPECSVGFYAPTTTGICGETCQPDRIYGIDSNGFCSLCPADLFFNPATSACVPLNECPRSAPYGDPSTGLCVSNAFECSLYLPLIDPESKLCVKSCKLSEYPESTTNICRPCSSSVSCTHCIYKDDWSYFASLVTSVFTPSGSLFCLLSDITRPSNYSSPLIVSGKSLSFINIMENSHATISPADSRSSATKIFSFSNSIISFDSVIFKGFKVKNNDGSVISVQSASVLTLEK